MQTGVAPFGLWNEKSQLKVKTW